MQYIQQILLISTLLIAVVVNGNPTSPMANAAARGVPGPSIAAAATNAKHAGILAVTKSRVTSTGRVVPSQQFSLWDFGIGKPEVAMLGATIAGLGLYKLITHSKQRKSKAAKLRQQEEALSDKATQAVIKRALRSIQKQS